MGKHPSYLAAPFGHLLPPVQDRLYVEYTVRFDPKHWELQTAWEQWEPVMLKVRVDLGHIPGAHTWGTLPPPGTVVVGAGDAQGEVQP